MDRETRDQPFSDEELAQAAVASEERTVHLGTLLRELQQKTMQTLWKAEEADAHGIAAYDGNSNLGSQ